MDNQEQPPNGPAALLVSTDDGQHEIHFEEEDNATQDASATSTKLLPIEINGNRLDPNEPQLASLSFGTEMATDSQYILVQTDDYLKKADKAALLERQVDLVEMVSDKTYLCRYEPTDLETIREIPSVKWVSTYVPNFVIDARLKPHTPASNTVPLSTHRQKVDVIFHQHHGKTVQELIDTVARAAHVDVSSVSGKRNQVRLTVQGKYLDNIARLDEVQTILPVVDTKPTNDVARNIVLGFANLNAEQNLFLPDNTPLRGQGQIIAVADTGLDATHHAFSGRVHAQHKLWPQPGRPPIVDDTDGHGTHVSGSVLGDGTYVEQGTRLRVQGTAPEARLVIQSVLDGEDFRTPDDLADLFSQAYKDGARVHNNSWGFVAPALPYSFSAPQIDKFVHENPDMVICFAAGNSGVDVRPRDGKTDSESLGGTAAAKNNITVGASENHRPDISREWDDLGGARPRFPLAPMKDDRVANDPHGLAAFSCRGPSQEARVKPDVVAPGTCILSARSANVEPDPLNDNFWGVSNDRRWTYNSGTSMACPLVSGGCALLRQALLPQYTAAERASAKPSAAVVKALLINGAVELKGQYSPSEAGPSPNSNSGWGRVNLKRSLSMAKRAVGGADTGFHEGIPLSDDDTFSRKIVIVGSAKNLKITLVWTDPPGALLQNNLKLTAASSNETKTGSPDDNNVKQIVWNEVPAGSVEIKVEAVRLISGTQPFALAWITF